MMFSGYSEGNRCTIKITIVKVCTNNVKHLSIIILAETLNTNSRHLADHVYLYCEKWPNTTFACPHPQDTDSSMTRITPPTTLPRAAETQNKKPSMSKRILRRSRDASLFLRATKQHLVGCHLLILPLILTLESQSSEKNEKLRIYNT